MRISVRVTAGAKIPKVEKVSESDFLVHVKEKAKENEANFAVIKALAEYFKIPQSHIRLMQGRTSRDKMFIVDQ